MGNCAPGIFNRLSLRREARELYDDTVHRVGEATWLRMSHHARWAELCIEFRDLVCEHLPETDSGRYLRDLSALLRRLFELRNRPTLAETVAEPSLLDPSEPVVTGRRVS